MSIETARKNAMLLSPPIQVAGNGPPPEETGQMKPWMDDPARRILEGMAPYATDFFGAQAQGLDPEDFWAVKWYEIRAADVFPSASISDNSRHGDWKKVVFRRRDIDYIPMGAKFWFWKNCWLAYNPENIGGAYSTAVVHRCNRVWTRYDYYGNILREPFVVERSATRANANEYNIYEGLPDHYNNCVMQANPETLGFLKENTRMVMGSAVYAVRGLSDYILEFTEDRDSVRLLYFSLYFQQPTERDDMELEIADGKTFSWVISVDGPRQIAFGASVQFSASSLRCGSPPDREVSYLWESLSDTLEVDETGKVTALAQGTGTIRCRLAQNPDLYTDTAVEVTAAGLSWASSVPQRLVCYQPLTLEVFGEKPVTWSFDGPPGNLWEANADGFTATLTAYFPSDIPLAVSVTDGENTLNVNLILTAR